MIQYVLENKLILAVFGQRVVNAIGGVFFGAIISFKYDATEGTEIYFMYSLALLFIVIEAGFPTLIVQRLSSDPLRREKYIPHYFACIVFLSSLMWLLLFVVGYFSSDNLNSLLAWLTLSITVPLVMVRSAIQNFYEGCKQLEKVAVERLLQALVAYFLLVLALIYDAGIWAIPTYYAALFFIPIFINLFFNNYSSLKGLKGYCNFSFLGFSQRQFFIDIRWQSKLIVQSISHYFSGNFWILALAVAGYYSVAPVIGFSNQVVFAVAGFSTMLFSARLPLLSEAYAKPDKGVFKTLEKSIWGESFVIFIGFFLVSVFVYTLVPQVFPKYAGKFGDPSYVWPYLFIFYLSFYVGSLTILENSKGFDSFFYSHVIKIVLSILVVSIFFLADLQEYVPDIYLAYWLLVSFVFKFFRGKNKSL